MASHGKAYEPFVYGTAWKREQTASLVAKALQNDFKSFDTACQPKHYREDLVGQALRDALSSGHLKGRADLHVQTKFSRPTAQDPSDVPYPLDAPLEDQIRASISRSLHNLRHEEDDSTAYLDCLMWHSPYPDFEDTMRAWRVFESYIPEKVRVLGISNARFEILKRLYDTAAVKPAIVQSRFHPETGFEGRMRSFCAEKRILFQSHKVLKGNKELLQDKELGRIGSRIGISAETMLYMSIQSLHGQIQIVNGTKNEDHMREDMDALRVSVRRECSSCADAAHR
ncbi:aldo/keto reductase [Seiridium cupressi]